jgi:hypothetical protein
MMNNEYRNLLIINYLQKTKKNISNFCFDIIEVLKPPVAAVLTAEYHASNAKLRIRRMNPPLQEAAKPKAKIAERFLNSIAQLIFKILCSKVQRIML